VLADFGADVVTVCKVSKGIVQSQNDPVSRGKRSIAIDLKSKSGIDVIKQLANKADVFIEPFRPGVAEKVPPPHQPAR
jgi:alpha-methylacyl-CoA racemase